MIKFENTEVVGWEAAIRGMRNPMNSWEKSDSGCPFCKEFKQCYTDGYDKCSKFIGPNDYKLMMQLCNAGSDHRKFMRMIAVYVDILAPLYWWKEFDTYKVGTVANSCSTMHKIADKEFTLEDFSCEHLFDDVHAPNFIGLNKDLLKDIVDALNYNREQYLQTKDKKYWWQMIQLLPSSYGQRRTVMMNYEVLANIYKSRKGHKLDEWSIGFMNWIESLPYSELIMGKEINNGQ